MSSVSPRSNGLDFSPMQPSSQNTIGDFIIGDKLGEGTFSKVCQGTHKTTKEKVAIKIMSKAQIKEPSDKIRIEKEINIQKRLHHNSIIQQYSIIETQTTIYIITEYCSGGELFDYIVSKRKLFEVEACRIFQQLISGLEYLHKQRIVHRDLKPENLLFDSKRNLKIADFGLSNEYKGKLSTPCGSPCYAAPEMVTGKKYNGSSVDIWSSGIVLYTMVCGYLPFEDENQNILFGKIAKGCFSLPTYLSPPCKDLLRKILVTDPNIRYGFEQIKHHPWFTSVNNVMGKNIFFNSPGIFINEDVIPIDENIVIELHEKFKYDLRNIISDLIRNKHNNITTSYYLILKRKVRLCEKSISDISPNSELFLAYIKKQISKMSHWNNDVEKIIDYYYKQVYNILNATNALDRNKNEDVSSINESEQIEILPTVNLNTITNLHFLNENECVGPTKSNGGYNVDGCNCNSNNNSEDNSNVNSNNKIDEIIINTQTTRSQQHQPRNAHNTPIDKSINHIDKNNLKNNNNPKTCRTNSLPKEYQQRKRVDIQMNFQFMNFDPAQSMKINHIKNSNSNKDIHNKNKNSRNISQEIPITCQKVLQTDNTPICGNNNNNKQNMNISSNKKQFGIDIYPNNNNNNNNNISNKNKQQLSSRKPNAMSITYNQPTIIKLSKPIYQNYKKKPVLPMSTQISKFINKKSPPPKGNVNLYNKTKHIKLITEPNGLEKDNIIQQDAIMSTEPVPYVKVNGSSNNKHHSSSLEHYKLSIRKLPLKHQQVKASEKKRPKSIEEYRLNTEIPVSSNTNTKTHANNNNNNNNSNSIKLTLPKKIVARNTRYNNTNYNNTSNNNNKQIKHNQQQQQPRKIKNNSVDDRDKNTFYHQLNTCEVYKKVPPKQNGAHVFNNTNIHRFSNNNSLNKNKLHSNSNNNNNNNDIHIQTTSNSVERKRYLNTSVIHIKDDNPTPLLEKKIDLIVKKRNNKILFPSHNRANHYSQEHVPKNSIDITCPTNNGNSFILLQINNNNKSRANSNNTTLKKHKKANASTSLHTNNNNNNHNHHNIITSTGCNNNTHGSTARNYKNMNKLRKFVNVPSNRKNDSNNIHHKALTLPKNSYKENALLKEKEFIINQNQNAYTICCKGTIDSIKDVIEDIIENKVTVNKIRNEKYLFICKCAGNNTKINNLLFELDVKRCNEVKDYFLINANMKNGIHKEYEAKVDKIKKRLLMENNNV